MIVASDAREVVAVRGPGNPLARLGRWAPWLITAGVVAVILHEHPLREIAAQLERGVAWPLLPLAIVSAVATLLVVATADWLVIRGYTGRGGWFDVVRAKAGTSLLDVVGYAAGHGAYAVWIGRFTGRRAKTAAQAMLAIMGGDLLSVSLVASVATTFAGPAVPDAVRWAAPAVSASLLLIFMLYPVSAPRWVLLAQAAIRTAHVVLWSFVVWVASRLFGLGIPLEVMLVNLPIILLVQSLPINVLGFGAVQAAWLLLFGEHSTGPEILAFQMVWTVAVLFAVVLRGVPFVARITEEVRDGTS